MLQSGPVWTNPTVLSAAGVIVTILLAAGGLIWSISKLSSKLDTANDVSSSIDTLSGRLNAIMDTYDMSMVSDVRNDIRGINEDVNEIATNMEMINDMNQSVNIIEESITDVDLEGMEDALKRLSDEGFSAGNSVEHTLELSAIDILISLEYLASGKTRISIEAKEDIEARTLSDVLAMDDVLDEFERDLFEGEVPTHRATSPRHLRFDVPSDDMDKIAQWVEHVVDRIDLHHSNLSDARNEFDATVEEVLEED